MKELKNLSRLVKTSSTLAVVLMVMATAAMPVVAGAYGTKETNDVADDFIIETEHGFGKVQVLMSLLFDKDSLSVIRDLRSKGYDLQYDKVDIQRIRSKENTSHESLLVIIHAKSENSTNSAQVIFTSNGERTCVANAIIEDGANYRKIDVYEIEDGTEKNYVVENRAGTISIDNETILTGLPQIGAGQAKPVQVVASRTCGDNGCHWTPAPTPTPTPTPPPSSDCRICRKVCNYISTAGCGLSGFIVCTAACSCFAGPACPPICAVVYALFCMHGSNKNCDTCCRSYC